MDTITRGGAFLVWCVAAVLLPVALLTSIAVFLHRDAIDYLYKNVEDISDGEMPATVTSFQTGPDVVSIIGGSGEGLNCSLPRWANFFFDPGKYRDSRANKRYLVLQRFRQACVFHDLCYRHGLATYGYNQNDCDRALQNAAFRLCLYIRNGRGPKEAARCQTDSKMVLAGVSLGGAGAYRAWDRSTYFEFESDPSRSSGFWVSRVVEHPFKAADPIKYRNDSAEVILTFENVRSNLSITCVTCRRVPILRETSDPNEISSEFQSVGINSLPESLLQHADQTLTDTGPLWLPPRRRHAAPHLLIDSAGKNHLIWMTRNNPGDTISCIVVTDAAKLLTTTLPRRDACAEGAGSPLTMVEVDMFATSPLPMEIPGMPAKNNIFATGISAQMKKGRPLSFCSRSVARQVDRDESKHDDRAKCHNFNEPEVADGIALGAFQNFAVVRPGQELLFARDIMLQPDSRLTKVRQRFFGEAYSSGGALLKIDAKAPLVADAPLLSQLAKPIRFDIDDRFDPMMPITRARDDLRFLSLEATKAQFGVRMIDFGTITPSPKPVGLRMNDTEVHLHPTWALRPVLVLETGGDDPKTRLVFSRGEIAPKEKPVKRTNAPDQSKRPPAPNKPVPLSEALTLETLVFERPAKAASNVPFVKKGGAACTVTYTFISLSDFPCYRPFAPDRPMRASPAARMQASQLLVGHFAGPGGHGIAFPDFCLKTLPIILRPIADGFEATRKTVGAETDIQRTVSCDPLVSNEHVHEPIYPARDETSWTNFWPLR